MKVKINILKCKPNHAIGNWVQAWLNLIDNIVMILTFGYVMSNLTIWWVFRRFKLGLYENETQKTNK